MADRQKLRVLFYVNSFAVLPEFWPLITAARDPCDIHLASRQWPQVVDFAHTRQAEASWHYLGPPRVSPWARPSSASAGPAAVVSTPQRRWLPAWLEGRNSVRDLRAIRSIFNECRAQRAEVELLFDTVRPQVVVSAADNNFGYEQFVMRAAARRGLPRHVIQTMGVSNDAMLTVFAANPANRRVTIVDWLVDQVFPKQSTYWKNAPVRAASSATVLAFAAAGALPRRPWVFGGSWASQIHADGPDARREVDRQAKGACLPILETGRASLDRLFQRASDRDNLRREFALLAGIPMDRPLLVVAMAPYAEGGVMDWPQHWEVTRSRAAMLREFAAARHASTVISLHPRMVADHYAFLSTEFGLPISPWPLRELLPIADAFCSTYFSDTVPWSLDLRLPTMVMAEHFPLPLYRSEPIDIVERDADALAVLERMVSDLQWRTRRSTELAARTPQFSNPGRATEAQLKLLLTCA